MSRHALFGLFLLAFYLGGCQQASQDPASNAASLSWNSDWPAALEQAKVSGKPILIAFARPDVSPWSARMQKEVFDTDAFSSWAQQTVVPLRIDFAEPQSDEQKEVALRLAQTYKVVGFPTVVIVDADGKERANLRYRAGGGAAWVSYAEETLAGAAPVALDWHHSYEEAAKESKASGKPIMMDFTGSDWCTWCIRLNQEVFATEKFQQWSSDRVVLLELDFPRNIDLDPALGQQNERLAARYGIGGFPTIVFTDHQGEPLGATGYVEGGPDAWFVKAEEAIGGAGKERLQRSP